MLGSTDEETRAAIEKLIGRLISRTHFYRLKGDTINDNEVTNWIRTFAKIRYLHHYQQRMKELTYSNQILLKSIADETKGPIEEWNKHLIGALIRNHREHEALLLAAGFGSRVLLEVKDLIDRGVSGGGNNNNIVNEYNQRYNITNKELGKDNRESRDTSEYRF